MYKKFFIFFLAAIFIFTAESSFAAQAKYKSKKKSSVKAKTSVAAQKINAKLDEITKELGLSPEQQIRVKEILEKSRQEYKSVLKEAKIKTKEIKIKANDKIKSLLSEEQKEKFKETRKKTELAPRIVEE